MLVLFLAFFVQLLLLPFSIQPYQWLMMGHLHFVFKDFHKLQRQNLHKNYDQHGNYGNSGKLRLYICTYPCAGLAQEVARTLGGGGGGLPTSWVRGGALMPNTLPREHLL